MKFRTEIEIPKSENPIEHYEKLIAIGSCFAENISGYFKYYKFNILENPFGVLYNPVSILNSFKLLLNNKTFTEEDLIFDQGEWHSFYHHSDFSHHKSEVCLDQINSKLAQSAGFLKETDYIIITYGTSFVFRHINSSIIVSNCHKIPQSNFHRYRLSMQDVKQTINDTVNIIHQFNSECEIIFTVSPVRHWKDGAIDNQISKSILLLAVNEIVNELSNCTYFPSYEIMMDDLRDYRFYASDLIHPNKIAVDYIWVKFRDSMLSDECINITNKVGKIIKARNHRVRNPESDKHRQFLQSNLDTIRGLKQQYPYIDFSEEEKYFQ